MKRFWDKVEKSDDADGCWLWKANRDAKGYGLFWLNRKYVRAHRVAWSLRYGAIGVEKILYHTCENYHCVNPDHLCLEKQQKPFWDNVIKRNNGCWEWQGGCNDKGYGCCQYKGRQRYAHRVAWLLMYGKIAEGMFVLHKCDNPLCVNVEHLFLGTHSDNMKDMAIKGRGARPGAKLNSKEVSEIRARYKNRIGLKKLACEYMVSPSTIWRIVRKKTWRHV